MSLIDQLLDHASEVDEEEASGIDEEDSGSEAELNTSTVTKKSRKITAISTWEHSRPPIDGEPKRRNGALIFYCKHNVRPVEGNPTIQCDYSVTGTTSIRYHLREAHDIIVEAGA